MMSGYSAISLCIFKLVQNAAACYLIAQATASIGLSNPFKLPLCSLNVNFSVSVFTFSVLCALDAECVQHTVEIAVNSFILWIQYKLFTARVRLVFAFLIVNPRLYHLIRCGSILSLLPLQAVQELSV